MLDSVKTGRKITDLRKSRGLTQEELAGRLNISPQAVSKWENGRAMPELSLLVELAEALGSTIDAIIFPEAAKEEAVKESPARENPVSLSPQEEILTE